MSTNAIPLSSLSASPATPLGGSTTTSQPPAQSRPPSTSQQNHSAANSTQAPPSTTAASASAQNAASPAQLTASWRLWKKACSIALWGLLLGLGGFVLNIVLIQPTLKQARLAQEGQDLASWTAAKEFKDSCQADKDRNVTLSVACIRALETQLPPPPHTIFAGLKRSLSNATIAATSFASQKLQIVTRFWPTQPQRVSMAMSNLVIGFSQLPVLLLSTVMEMKPINIENLVTILAFGLCLISLRTAVIRFGEYRSRSKLPVDFKMSLAIRRHKYLFDAYEAFATHLNAIIASTNSRPTISDRHRALLRVVKWRLESSSKVYRGQPFYIDEYTFFSSMESFHEEVQQYTEILKDLMHVTPLAASDLRILTIPTRPLVKVLQELSARIYAVHMGRKLSSQIYEDLKILMGLWKFGEFNGF